MWFIQIKTGSSSGAGSQATVGLRLVGPTGQESPTYPSYYSLDNRSDDRERCRLDTYYPGDSGLDDIGGRVDNLYLYFDPLDDVTRNAWHLDWIRIGPGRPRPDAEVKIGQKWKLDRWLTERGWYTLGELLAPVRFARKVEKRTSSSLVYSLATANTNLPVFTLRPRAIEE